MRINMTRRGGLASLAALSALMVSAVHAKPTTVTLVVTTPPGTPFDANARRIQPELSRLLGIPVVVENVPGGSGSIGTQRALTKDVSTERILVASPQETVLPPLTIPGLRYSPSDFRLIALMVTGSLVLMVRPGLPVQSLPELISLASRPGTPPLTYGSSGQGTLFHLVGSEFGQRLSIATTHVPYKGGASAVQDLAGNQIDMAFLPLAPTYIQMAEAGKLRILAVLSADPNPALPRVPSVDTVKRLRGFYYSLWAGLFVSADLPLPTAEALRAAALEIIGATDYQDWVRERGATPGPTMTLLQAAEFYESETARFTRLARAVKTS